MSNTRLDQMLVMFVNALPNDFYVNQPIPGDKSVLSITQRAPVGSRWPNGQKYREVGKMSRFQANTIEGISPTIEEGAERIRLLIIEGKDTAKAAAPPSAEQLAEMVAKLAAIEVDRRIKEIENGTVRRDLVERAIVSEAVLAVTPRLSPLPKPKAARGDKIDVAGNEAKVALWTKRAEAMGHGEPVVLRTGKIDGRWLRHASAKWVEHEAKHPETAVAP